MTKTLYPHEIVITLLQTPNTFLESSMWLNYGFCSIIITSLHAHVNQERCLDIVIVHGEGEQIKILTERFMAIKGIESVKLTTIQIEK